MATITTPLKRATDQLRPPLKRKTSDDQEPARGVKKEERQKTESAGAFSRPQDKKRKEEGPNLQRFGRHGRWRGRRDSK